MDKQKIIEQMSDIISSDFQFEPNDFADEIEPINADEYDVPELKDDEFLLCIDWENKTFIVCVKELDWVTVQNIEVAAYKKRRLDEGKYFVGEYECRHILSKAIIWITDIVEKQCIHNDKETILTKLKDEFVDLIWTQYYPKVSLTAQEANALYAASIAYFTGDVQDKPIPSLIIEIDMLIKMGTMSRKEIKEIKASEMQRMKLILKARSEALSFQNNGSVKTNNSNQSELMKEIMNLPPSIMPPGIKGGFNIPM